MEKEITLLSNLEGNYFLLKNHSVILMLIHKMFVLVIQINMWKAILYLWTVYAHAQYSMQLYAIRVLGLTLPHSLFSLSWSSLEDTSCPVVMPHRKLSSPSLLPQVTWSPPTSTFYLCIQDNFLMLPTASSFPQHSVFSSPFAW